LRPFDARIERMPTGIRVVLSAGGAKVSSAKLARSAPDDARSRFVVIPAVYYG